MTQMTLYSPEITCEHCIATIQQAVDGVDGARFLHGDPDRRLFAVDIGSGAVLDAVTAALEAEGYPLGDAASAPPAADSATDAGWKPEYRVTRTDAGADVNYSCPCSCDAGFAFDRSRAEHDSESCCCGRRIMVGADAEARLRAELDGPEGYEFDVQRVAMPWGQPLEVALATPSAGAEHGSERHG